MSAEKKEKILAAYLEGLHKESLQKYQKLAQNGLTKAEAALDKSAHSVVFAY